MTLFDRLCDHYRADPDRKGEVWVDCPFCGKSKSHFSFRDNAYKCFACGAHGSLRKLAAQLRLDTDGPEVAVVRQAAPVAAPEWQARAWEIVSEHCQHAAHITRWQAYKPISATTIVVTISAWVGCRSRAKTARGTGQRANG